MSQSQPCQNTTLLGLLLWDALLGPQHGQPTVPAVVKAGSNTAGAMFTIQDVLGIMLGLLRHLSMHQHGGGCFSPSGARTWPGPAWVPSHCCECVMRPPNKDGQVCLRRCFGEGLQDFTEHKEPPKRGPCMCMLNFHVRNLLCWTGARPTQTSGRFVHVFTYVAQDCLSLLLRTCCHWKSNTIARTCGCPLVFAS